MVASTTKRLFELKEDVTSSTWFQEHSMVFTDDARLGDRHIVVSEEEKNEFFHKVYRPYRQSVIDHINVRMESTELISAMSVFDPRHLPCTEEKLSDYGIEQINTLTDFYGVEQKVNVGEDVDISQPDISAKETQSEWKLFRRLIFLQYNGRSIQFCTFKTSRERRDICCISKLGKDSRYSGSITSDNSHSGTEFQAILN